MSYALNKIHIFLCIVIDTASSFSMSNIGNYNNFVFTVNFIKQNTK